jgi:hypothetical protein
MTESDKERAERVGDPKLQSAYRALGAEEPPRALDEAVLAASRRALKVHPAPLVAPTGRRPWFVPLAAAAVLALAVGVTLHMQMEQPGVESPEPANKPSAPAARDTAPGAAQDTQLARKKEEPVVAVAERAAVPPKSTARSQAEAFPSSAQDRAVAENRAAEAAPARPAAAAAPAPPMEAPALAKRADAASEVGSVAGSVAAPPAPAAAAPAMRAMQRERVAAEAATAEKAVLTPEKELERIAELRKQGLHDEADKALAEFRKRYPEFKIPPAMLERVERR